MGEVLDRVADLIGSLSAARDTLNQIRKPSLAMIRAGMKIVDGSPDWKLADVFTAMIDAELTEPSEHPARGPSEDHPSLYHRPPA